MSIEQPKLQSRARAWEEKRLERILSGEERVVKLVANPKEYEWRKNKPSLAGTQKASDIKYDEVGNLLTSWWTTLRTERYTDGKRYLVNPKGIEYRVLYPNFPRTDYLNNLPQDLPVVGLVLGRVKGGIEVAIRQQRHVLDRYQPGTAAKEVEFARRVIEYTESCAQRILSRRSLSREDLQVLARETGNFLESVGLYNPRDARKKKILDKLVSMPPWPNYLVVLSKIYSTHAAAVERLTIGAFPIEKFDRNLQVLAYYRENMRWRLRLCAGQLRVVLGHVAFEKPGRSVTLLQREGINNAIKAAVEENLTEAKVKPYLPISRWAAINLVGCRDDKKEINQMILGEEIAKKLFAQEPVTDLVNTGDFREAGRRLGLSIKALERGLKTYESIEKA